MQLSKVRRGIPLLAATLALFGIFCEAFAAAPPPPTGGPPAPVLAKIEVSGPMQIDEGGSGTYVCTATYSDGSKATVDPVWSVDSTYASIDSSGELAAGDVSADETVDVTASYNGKSASVAATIVYLAPILDHLVVSGPTSVEEGGTASYTCNAHYSDGSSIPVVPAWSVSSASASIDASGALAAGSVDADEQLYVVATYDGKTRNYAVTVLDVPVVLEALVISGPLAVNENSGVQLECIGYYSDGSQPAVDPVWSVGSEDAQINATGWFHARDVSADVGVTVTATLDGITGTHNVLVKYVPPMLERIEISGPASVPEESGATYTCAAYYDDGTSEAVEATWSEDSIYAGISPSGALTTDDVQSDQTFTLTATYGGKSDAMQVGIVYDVPHLVSLTIDGATLVEEGAGTLYTCNAVYSDGTGGLVDPVWDVVPAEFVQIDSTGQLQAGGVNKDELVTVSAFFGGSNATYEVTVLDVPPPVTLDDLSIVGATEMQEGATTTLTCQATYSDGTVEPVVPLWTDDSPSASVSAQGVFFAGNAEVDGSVEITAAFGGLTASHTISVWMVPTQIVYPLEGFAGKQLKAELYDGKTGEWSTFGPFEDKDEIIFEGLGTNQWYWVSVLESNTVSNAWVEVQGNWLNM